MDELSPEAEAKDMELVATRGEDEQGSEAQFWRQPEQSDADFAATIWRVYT